MDSENIGEISLVDLGLLCSQPVYELIANFQHNANIDLASY